MKTGISFRFENDSRGEPTCRVAEMGNLLNLEERRIQQLAKAGIIPRPKRGRYPLVGSVRAYVEYLQDCAFKRDTSDPGATEMRRERIRLWRARADRETLELGRLRGTLLDREVVGDTWGKLVVNFRSRILAVPSRLALTLAGVSDPAAVHGRLEKELHAALAELSEDGSFAKGRRNRRKRDPAGESAPDEARRGRT